jgi:hypothetical protein
VEATVVIGQYLMMHFSEFGVSAMVCAEETEDEREAAAGALEVIAGVLEVVTVLKGALVGIMMIVIGIVGKIVG